MSDTALRPDPGTVTPPRDAIDPRGPRFAAVLTSAVLAAALLLPAAVGTALLAVQVAVFALGAARGARATPYAWLFRTLVRPHLAAPTTWEEPGPPRFAQAVGLVFAGFGLVALLSGATLVGQAAVGAALVAALLNAVFDLCLGCELYLLVRRATA